MIHPSTELRFINDEIGYGVVATRFIPKGTIVWALTNLTANSHRISLISWPLYKEILLNTLSETARESGSLLGQRSLRQSQFPFKLHDHTL